MTPFGYRVLGFGSGGKPPVEYNIEYLMVGGGGGGTDGKSYRGSGGSGAGGHITASGFTIDDATNYTVTVGAGGAMGGGNASGTITLGTQGGHSIFSTLTAYGGGRGGNPYAGRESTDTDGTIEIGSGGGFDNDYYPSTYSFNSAQGSSGGKSQFKPGSGGGGKGADGTAVGASSQPNGGTGGNGTASSITGSSVTRAGGGGGGGSSNYGSCGNAAGGSGGGGAGGCDGAGSNGGTNLGGGGGGGSGTAGGGSTVNNGGNGGSGVVILKIADADYSGVVTGSPTVDTSSVADYTILIFNASGSYHG